MRKATVVLGLYLVGGGVAFGATPIKQKIHDFLHDRIHAYADQATENCHDATRSDEDRQAVETIIIAMVTLQTGPNGALLTREKAQSTQDELQAAAARIRVTNPAAYDCSERAIPSVNNAVMTDFIAKSPEFARERADQEESEVTPEQTTQAQQKAEVASARLAAMCFGYGKDIRISESAIHDLVKDSIILSNKRYFLKSNLPIPDARSFEQRWSEFADQHYGPYECVEGFVGSLENRLLQANLDKIR